MIDFVQQLFSLALIPFQSVANVLVIVPVACIVVVLVFSLLRRLMGVL